ncbi:unnamed protein product, partial [Rotaria sp. Silwood2]
NVCSAPAHNSTLNVSTIHALAYIPPCTMTKTKCYGVVLACRNYRCQFSTLCRNFCCEKSCGSWYVCGACFGLPFG